MSRGRTVVLVEGESDKAAVLALARKRGHDLEGDGVDIRAMGGAHALRRVLGDLRASSPDLRIAVLCDVGEHGRARRVLAAGGLELRGLFVCDRDLEDELIRALGPADVERVIDGLGEMRSLRSMQRQPAQRNRPVEAQLRRFIGTHSGRKALYARALTEACADAGRVPLPLDQLLRAVAPGAPDWIGSGDAAQR